MRESTLCWWLVVVMVRACRASAVLRNETAVDAVELFDRASLRECEADEAMTKLVRPPRRHDSAALAAARPPPPASSSRARADAG